MGVLTLKGNTYKQLFQQDKDGRYSYRDSQTNIHLTKNSFPKKKVNLAVKRKCFIAIFSEHKEQGLLHGSYDRKPISPVCKGLICSWEKKSSFFFKKQQSNFNLGK